MSSPSQAGRHRAPQPGPAPAEASGKRSTTLLGLAALAVVTTGLVVGGGALLLRPAADIVPPVATSVAGAGLSSVTELGAPDEPDTEAAERRVEQIADAIADRAWVPVTRSDNRAAADPLKQVTLSVESGRTMARTEDLSDEAPRDIARALLATYGWGEDQFSCLDALWMRESRWNPFADNPNSSAYGIPQALPGSKMASAGADWRTNPVTQIKWGLGYIEGRYGTPCGAWAHSQRRGYY